MEVFLGGTTNGSAWRQQLIPQLKMSYVTFEQARNLTELRQQREAKAKADFCLYVITPLMQDLEQLSELLEESHKRPGQTLLCLLKEEGGLHFDEQQWQALQNIGTTVVKNGAHYFEDLQSALNFLNQQVPLPG
jgi:hypothetical protein